jgi:hypothetical protein
MTTLNYRLQARESSRGSVIPFPVTVSSALTRPAVKRKMTTIHHHLHKKGHMVVLFLFRSQSAEHCHAQL